MTKITLVIDDELLIQFREAAFQKHGFRKGSLSEFFEDAVKCVLKEIAEEEKHL